MERGCLSQGWAMGSLWDCWVGYASRVYALAAADGSSRWELSCAGVMLHLLLDGCCLCLLPLAAAVQAPPSALSVYGARFGAPMMLLLVRQSKFLVPSWR